jgi:hypothetical protein
MENQTPQTIATPAPEPEKGQPDKAEIEKFAEITRDMIKHENELVNHRMVWMINFQGFLIAAASFLWGSYHAKSATIALAILGGLMALSHLVALRASHLAITKLQQDWRDYLAANKVQSKGPRVIGLGAKECGFCKTLLLPWNALPPLLVLVWIAFAIFSPSVSKKHSPRGSASTQPAVVVLDEGRR